ncbi:MAG TPA: protein phosphatase 2C domain-containing protein [Propionicimonas sp.]|nr:protein phosphatase 2C domain-containing protein [Propionicimonas sp.]
MQTSAPRLAGLAIGEAGAAGCREYLSLPGASPFHVPDTAVDGVSSVGIELRAAATRGISHRAHREPRQDAYGFDLGEDWAAFAVADGLGSQVDSQLSSHLAVQLAVTAASAALLGGHDPDWASIFGEVSAAIETSLPRAAKGTTLTIAALRRESVNWLVSIGSLGDSRAAILRDGTWCGVADPPKDHNELASSVTEALPVRDLDRVRAGNGLLVPGQVLALFSDGIGAAFGKGSGVVGAHLAQWWQTAPPLLDFAAQVSFQRRGFHDDRSAVVVWNTGPDAVAGRPKSTDSQEGESEALNSADPSPGSEWRP